MDKENVNANLNVPKDTLKEEKIGKTEEKEQPTLIKTYEYDESQNKTTEQEFFTKLNLFRHSVVAQKSHIEQQCKNLKFLQFCNIEKVVMNSLASGDVAKRLQNYFIMGVVVQKKVLAKTENKNKKFPNNRKYNSYVQFQLSDLQRYKSSLMAKIQESKKFSLYGAAPKQSQEEMDKTKAYKSMNFTADRYKFNEFILFGSTAEAFSKTVKYGDLILIKNPTVMDKKYNNGICLSAKTASQIMVIGKCQNFGICKGDKCPEFLNTLKHSKCMLHVEEDNDLQIKKLKANRLNVRSDFIDSEKINALKKHEKKLHLQKFGFGFQKARVEENDYKLTPEMKRKMKLQQKQAEAKYNYFMEKRNKKESMAPLAIDQVKCREKEYISSRHDSEIDGICVVKAKQPKVMELDSDGGSVN